MGIRSWLLNEKSSRKYLPNNLKVCEKGDAEAAMLIFLKSLIDFLKFLEKKACL
jgi:hypothetical protein